MTPQQEKDAAGGRAPVAAVASPASEMRIASSEGREGPANFFASSPSGSEGEGPSPPRPASIKRVRTEEGELSKMVLSLPPPPDFPCYLQACHLPVWVGRTPVELGPEKADELHHVQWQAWKCGGGGSGAEGDDEKDYARILEVAASIFNVSFVRLNPHNFAITVGITVDAMHKTGSPPLACATTFLYGLSLLADNPSKQTIPIQFCRAAPSFMEEWAREAFESPREEEVVESLLEFCGVYPHSGLPDVLGKRVEACVEHLMAAGKNKEALRIIRRCLEAPWAQDQKVWDEDVYWKLRLLSYICKRRARQQEGTLPPSAPATMKMVVVAFRRSTGRLPLTLEDHSQTVECGLELSEAQLAASIDAMRHAFDLFSESFLALTKGAIQWELAFKPEAYVFGPEAAAMPARPFHREVEAPTNPNRLIAQADVEACPAFLDFLEQRGREDEDVRTAQAVMVLWPGLRAPGSYMLTCGGITPHGVGHRAVFMSDGAMLSGRPVWSPMWFHHEFFHCLEHVMPETPFSEASQVCGHPVFIRDQWPAYYEGNYEWDFYYHSYKHSVLHPSVQPPLAARITRIPTAPHVHAFDISRRDTASIMARICYPGDIVRLRPGNGLAYTPSSSISSPTAANGHQHGSGGGGGGGGGGSTGRANGHGHGGHGANSSSQGGALGFKPGALPAGLLLTPSEDCEGNNWGFAVFWVQEPPCYLITMAKGGRDAHEALLDSLLGESAGGADKGPSSSSSSSSSSPLKAAAGGGRGLQEANGADGGNERRKRRERIALLPEWPVEALKTDGFVEYAQDKVQECLDQGMCTFVATGSSWMPQAFYVCRTCRELNSTNGANVGCCLPCAARCHAGHDLEARPPARFYCDCGLGNFVGLTCQCRDDVSSSSEDEERAAAAAEGEGECADGGDSGRRHRSSSDNTMPTIMMAEAEPGDGHHHHHHHCNH